jgi:hypothetical protein
MVPNFLEDSHDPLPGWRLEQSAATKVAFSAGPRRSNNKRLPPVPSASRHSDEGSGTDCTASNRMSSKLVAAPSLIAQVSFAVQLPGVPSPYQIVFSALPVSGGWTAANGPIN